MTSVRRFFEPTLSKFEFSILITLARKTANAKRVYRGQHIVITPIDIEKEHALLALEDTSFISLHPF